MSRVYPSSMAGRIGSRPTVILSWVTGKNGWVDSLSSVSLLFSVSDWISVVERTLQPFINFINFVSTKGARAFVGRSSKVLFGFRTNITDQ